LSAGSGYFSLGTMTTQLARTTAGASSDTNERSGYSSGHTIPITPTGSWILMVAPYSVVSYRRQHNCCLIQIKLHYKQVAQLQQRDSASSAILRQWVILRLNFRLKGIWRIRDNNRYPH